MAKKSFTPKSVKTLLTFLMIVVILGGGGMFYLGLGMTRDFSVEVNKSLEAADNSSRQLEQLGLLRGKLSDSESLTASANALFAAQNNWQSKTSADLQNYAKRVGLTLDTINFDKQASDNHVVTFRLIPPVDYNKLIQFLSLIEDNLPKMQVTSIDLKHKVGGGANDVEVGDIKIDVSVR